MLVGPLQTVGKSVSSESDQLWTRLWLPHPDLWFIGEVWKSKSQVKVHSYRTKKFLFHCGLHVTMWYISWKHVTTWHSFGRLLSFCGKVIGATSTEGFLLDLDHRITTYIYITLYIPLTGNQLLLVATNQSVFLPVQEILISYPDAGQSPRWTQVGLMLLISGAWEDDPNGSPSRELEENTRASQYHVAEHHPTRPESLQPYTELSSWPGPEPPSV